MGLAAEPELTGAERGSLATPGPRRVRLPGTPGTYVLILHVPRSTNVRVGKLGVVTFRRGYYAYVGSAFGPGGLAARVERHVRTGVGTHWHIDYLRKIAQPVGVWLSAKGVRREHEWAKALQRAPWASNAVPRFGASDCKCASHLLYLGRRVSKGWMTSCLQLRTPLRYLSLAAAPCVARRGGGRVR
jgi:Uri superfamily endonuclease